MSTVLRREAEESISSGLWDEALEKLEQLKRSEEWSLDLYPELAKVNAVRGRFLTVLSLYLEWASSAVEAGEFEQAERALGYAQSLRPDSPEVQEMAVKIARHNVTLEALADRLVELAHLHLEKGDGDRAVSLVEEAIQARPDDHSLKLQLGETLVANGQITSGLKIFQDYVEVHSDCGDPNKLREPLQRINLLKPDDKETMLHLGRVYLALDEVDRAEDQFRAVLKQDLENQEALLELARVCQKKGLFRNGLLALNRVVLKNPELPSAHRQMAEIHLAAGSPDKAVSEFLEAARLYSQAEENSVVIELYRTVLRIDGENSAALNALRGLSLQCGEDLTVNLFPPIEESLDEPPVEETRPGPLPPGSEKSDGGFQEMNLLEKVSEEKPEMRVSELLPNRPAMTPKSGLSKPGGGKPVLMPSGQRQTSRPLRQGLISRANSGKRSFHRSEKVAAKPFFTREEPAAQGEPPEPVVTIEPEVPDPLLELPPVVDDEKELPPEVSVDPTSPNSENRPAAEVGDFESIFTDVDSLFEKNESISDDENALDIPAFEEVFEESNQVPEEDSEVATEIEESIFDFKFEEDEPESLAPLDTETVESVDADVLFPPLEELSQTAGEVEQESSIFSFDSDWMVEANGEPLTSDCDTLSEQAEVEPRESAGNRSLEIETSEYVQQPSQVSIPEGEEVLNEPQPESNSGVSVDDHLFEDPMPTFEWELDFETPDEPEASPLFADVETVEETDEVLDSLEFERLRAAEISRLAREDEMSAETPELIRLLEDTLPQPIRSEPIDEVVEPEVFQVEEAEVFAETEVSARAVEEDEDLEAADVATRIESYRQRLLTYSTDESAALALADTCLRYGLLEEALRHYRMVQKANPGCPETSARIIKAALWMEDIPTVKSELWQTARLSFDLGDLKACQDRLGDLLSLDREHKEARRLMVEVFLAGGQEKLAAWHLGQMVERAIGEEEYELAIDSLKRLNDISPNDAALEKLAELYQKQYRLDEALNIFRQLRTSHLKRDELEEAVRLARQVVDLDPQRTDDREVLIELLQTSERQAEVIDQKLELAKLYRQNSESHRSIQLLQTVLQDNPEHLDAERVLVELHLQNGSLELAEQHAESLAERFLDQKAYQKAIDLFEYWVGAAPASTRARERLAQFYQLNGDLQGAKMEWLMVTESHQAAGDFQRAARSLERALELDPQQSEWRLRLAQLKAQELGQMDSALNDFRLLFQGDPTWRKATVCYLDLLMEQGRMAELGEVLQELERLNFGADLKDNVIRSVKDKMVREPDNFELAFGWGELCLALGMLDLAIEQFQRLRRHEHYQLHSYRLLGLCFSRKKGFNMVELALSQFKRGLALEGQTAEDRLELQYARACVLTDHGREEEAAEQLRKIAAEDPNYRDVAKRLEKLG